MYNELEISCVTNVFLSSSTNRKWFKKKLLAWFWPINNLFLTLWRQLWPFCLQFEEIAIICLNISCQNTDKTGLSSENRVTRIWDIGTQTDINLK